MATCFVGREQALDDAYWRVYFAVTDCDSEVFDCGLALDGFTDQEARAVADRLTDQPNECDHCGRAFRYELGKFQDGGLCIRVRPPHY